MQIRPIILCLLLAGVAPASDRQPQVDAARASALQRLAADVVDEQVAIGVSVEQFIRRTNSEDLFSATIAQARQVGGARWLDDQTCQVRVDLPADRVTELLINIQQSNPNRSPVGYDDLLFREKIWRGRVFSATGSSVTWDRAQKMVPPPQWRAVNAETRRSALERARTDAARRAVDAVLASGAGDAAALEPISQDEPRRQQLEQWVSMQPITSVRFADDKTIELSLAVPPAQLAQAARDSSGGAADDPAWRRIGDRIAGLPPIVTGMAQLSEMPPHAYAAASSVVIPAAPPAWVQLQLDAEAVAEPKSSQLKTARSAENKALQNLRDRIDQLQWDASTLRDAAKSTPAIGQAIDRAVSAARVVAVDYRADGSVRVRIILSGQSLWKEISDSTKSPE